MRKIVYNGLCIARCLHYLKFEIQTLEIMEKDELKNDCFSFARYFNEHFEYFDNTDVGDVYVHKSGDGLYSWFNNR